MSNIRRQTLKPAAFLLFLCLLLWTLGASPLAGDEEKETHTPTGTLAESSPTAKATPSEPPQLDPTVTSLPFETEPPPLPSIFSAGPYVPGQLVVRFKPSTSGARIDECFQGVEAAVQAGIGPVNAYLLTSSQGELAGLYSHILDCAGVLYVEPNFLLQAADTFPNDPGFGLQYGLVNIRAPQGWDYATGSSAVTIAVVDSGVDYNHPDLAGKLSQGYDFVNNDDVAQDDNGHGTHVAGIAAASSNNGTGIAGVSWGARLLPVKVLNSAGSGSYADAAAGIIWAADQGAQVINLSLGGSAPSSLLEDAIRYARSQGAVLVAAAGNAGSNFVSYPARYPGVIAVARTGSGDSWEGSNYGPEIDLAAPGTAIYSTVTGGYGDKTGSSMSTAFVSGLAAILMGIPGNASPDLVEQQMESSALDIDAAGWDPYTGAGLIQMDAAIRLALPPPILTGSPPGQPPEPGPGPVGPFPAPTSTPTWTISPTGTSTTATATGTITASPAVAGTHSMTSAPTTPANELQAQTDRGPDEYLLPCAGAGLILLGVLLALTLRRKS